MKSNDKQPPLTVMGVDLLYHGGKGRAPHFSVVVLRDNEIVAENPEVSLHRLIRLLWEYRPNILAVDNVFELGEDERKLAKFFNLIPPEVRVIQVTRWPEGFLKIKEAAIRAGLEVAYGKPSPLRTAYLAALIASKGYGTEVKLYEEKTKIIISRTASIGPGGMSQNRYKRRLRGIVLSLTRKIKESLDRYGLDYDLTFRKSGGGLDSSVFIVYAPREKLYGIVKPLKTSDVRIEIRPIYKPKISFLQQERERQLQRYLIVGVDPGISTGLAILDIDGAPLEIISGRGLDRSDIVNHVLAHGTPIIVATDVNPVPETVKRLAAMFNAELYVPSQSLSSDEKRQIVQEYISKYHWITVEDNHQRDALAAAVRAFHSIESKLRQVESYVSKLGLEIQVDKIKVAVIKGKSTAEAVEEEIAKLYEEEEEGEEEEVEREEKTEVIQEESEVEERLREEIKRLKRERQYLKERVRELEEKVSHLEFELDYKSKVIEPDETTARTIEMLKQEVRRLTEYSRSLESEITALRNMIASSSKLFLMLMRGEAVPAKKIHMLTSDALAKLEREYGELRENDILYIENPGYFEKEALEKAAESKILAVILDEIEGAGLIDALKKKFIPVLKKDDYSIGELYGSLLVSKRIVEDAKRAKKKLEEEASARERARILELLKEYKAKRRRELLKEIEK